MQESKASKKPEKGKFLKLDIENFYPSIKFELLKKALDWAENFDTISEMEKAIIFNVRKTFLFFNKTAWMKRSDNNFDISQAIIYDTFNGIVRQWHD